MAEGRNHPEKNVRMAVLAAVAGFPKYDASTMNPSAPFGILVELLHRLEA